MQPDGTSLEGDGSTGPDLMGHEFGLALGDFRKEPAARQGAGKPVGRFRGSSRKASQSLLRFSERARTVSPFIRRAFRPWPSAADGRIRSAEKRDADARGRGGEDSKGSCRLPVGCSRFAAHPSNRPGPRVVGSARLRRRFVLGGRDGHCRETSPQGAEAMRQWQGRVMGAVEPYRLVRGVRSAKAIRHRPGAFAEVFASRRT